MKAAGTIKTLKVMKKQNTPIKLLKSVLRDCDDESANNHISEQKKANYTGIYLLSIKQQFALRI